MDPISTIIVGAILFLYTWFCKPWLYANYPKIKITADLMLMAVSMTLIVLLDIAVIGSGILPASSFFIVVPSLVGFFVYYGITHREEAAQEMRRTYNAVLVGYSYIFITSAVFMGFALPFMKDIVL